MCEQAISVFLYTISVSIILCTIVSILDTIQDWKRMNKIIELEKKEY